MGAVTPGRTVDLVLYPSEHFGVPALPEFPKDSRTRLRSAVARCQAKLFPQLKRIWAGVVPEGCRAPSGSYEQFIPSFIGYSEGLFEVFARELSLLEADPDQFQQLLDKSLVWRALLGF